jgi:hypothetical protein
MTNRNDTEATERRAAAKARKLQRREARGIKLDLRDMWSTEESESC